MIKALSVFLACMCLSVFGAAAVPEAKPVTMEGLNAKQQRIVTIAAFTAVGDLHKLRTALNGGLDAGLTINEIKEILVQLYAYAGFPRSLNGITTFMDVLANANEKAREMATSSGATISTSRAERLQPFRRWPHSGTSILSCRVTSASGSIRG